MMGAEPLFSSTSGVIPSYAISISNFVIAYEWMCQNLCFSTLTFSIG